MVPCKSTVRWDKHQSCWPFLYCRVRGLESVSCEHLNISAHTLALPVSSQCSNDWGCDVMSYNYMPRQLQQPAVLSQLARDLIELWTFCYPLHIGYKKAKFWLKLPDMQLAGDKGHNSRPENDKVRGLFNDWGKTNRWICQSLSG